MNPNDLLMIALAIRHNKRELLIADRDNDSDKYESVAGRILQLQRELDQEIVRDLPPI